MSRALLRCGFSFCECSSFRSPVQALLQHGILLPPSKRGCCQASKLRPGTACYWSIQVMQPKPIQFSSVQSLSRVRLFAIPWTAVRQASLSITNSWSSPKLMSIESVMPSNHLILCRPLLLPPSIFPRIKAFSKESVLRISWPKYWSFSFNISPWGGDRDCTSFFFLIFIYSLFLAVLGLHCCTQAFSSCGEQELLSSGTGAPHSGGFSCCGAWAAERTSSVVVARGLSCSAACRILVP